MYVNCHATGEGLEFLLGIEEFLVRIVAEVDDEDGQIVGAVVAVSQDIESVIAIAGANVGSRRPT